MDKLFDRVFTVVSIGFMAMVAWSIIKPRHSHAGHNVTDGYCFTCERAR